MSDPLTPIPSSAAKNDVLKVTLDDLQALPDAAGPVAAGDAVTPGSGTIYGTINEMPADPALPDEKASILLQGWFYLGVAGLLGALAGWAICEPGFVDGPNPGHWGNLWMLPMIVAMVGVGCSVAESAAERSLRKGLIRLGIALPLGILFGFFFNVVANIIYSLGLTMLQAAGVHSMHNPGAWIARGVAWIAFGVAGGLVYGIVGQSGKKAAYGALGGAVGALVGGCVFDPIAFAGKEGSGAVSRVVGFALLGLATGVAMGLVESALKDRWLYVTSGPLAGKQFILYKPVTVVGSSQQADIYLFKDAEILPAHATLALKGSKLHLTAAGAVYVGGSPVRGARVLDSGAAIRIGRYGFKYQEKQR